MKFVLAFAVGALLFACCCTPALAPARGETRDVVEDLRAKTVVLLLDGTLCSGVWVSPWAIVTANHCVDEHVIGQGVTYTTHDDLFPGGILEAVPSVVPRLSVVTDHDEAHDLALLFAIHPPAHGIAYVRRELPRAGSFAHTMGHPIGLWYSYSTGVVAAVRGKDLGDGARLWLQCTAPISPGNSGGGLFDEAGALIGVADAIIERGFGVYLSTPSMYVDDLMRRGR